MAAPGYRKQSAAPSKPNSDDGPFVRSSVKLMDLPLASAQRNAIDALVLSFKRKGEFDKLRKSIYAEFTQSVRPLRARLLI